MVPIISPFNSLVCPLQKLGESWRIIIYYHKPKQVVALTAAQAWPVPLIEHINMASVTKYMVKQTEHRIFWKFMLFYFFSFNSCLTHTPHLSEYSWPVVFQVSKSFPKFL